MTREVLGTSSGRGKEDKEPWWWNAEVQDIQQVRMIKDADGRVLDSEEAAAKNLKGNFEVLLNEENDRGPKLEEAEKMTGPVPEVDREIRGSGERHVC